MVDGENKQQGCIFVAGRNKQINHQQQCWQQWLTMSKKGLRSKRGSPWFGKYHYIVSIECDYNFVKM